MTVNSLQDLMWTGKPPIENAVIAAEIRPMRGEGRYTQSDFPVGSRSFMMEIRKAGRTGVNRTTSL